MRRCECDEPIIDWSDPECEGRCRRCDGDLSHTLTARPPAYPEIVVSLKGTEVEVFNRVVQALRDADVPEERRVIFMVAAVATKEPARVARLWVTEKEEQDGEGQDTTEGRA